MAGISNTGINLWLLKYKYELEKLLKSHCCEENLKSDSFNIIFRHLEQQKGTWIFSIDVWCASSDYVEMLHWNSVSIPIQKDDLMVSLHIDAPDYTNNPNDLTVKELFISWLKRAQEQISSMSPLPKYITCFSHLAWKLSKKYPIFQNHSLGQIFQQESGANKFVFKTYELLWFGNEDVIRESLHKLNNPLMRFAPYGKKKIKNKIAIHEAAIALGKKYSPSDISFAVASVDDFLAYDFSQ